MKVEWKYITNVTGVLSVTLCVAGASKRPTSSVDSLATLLHPRPGGMLTLVVDQGWFSWAMLHVMEMNQASISVITVDGLINTDIVIMATTLG